MARSADQQISGRRASVERLPTGDPLERLAGAVNFEAFRYRLEKALKRSDRTRGGRPPYAPVLMFKVLILQALYGLSDAQAEFMIRDRLSFLHFLGLGLADAAPDATTIWLFRGNGGWRAVHRRVDGRKGEGAGHEDRFCCLLNLPDLLRCSRNGGNDVQVIDGEEGGFSFGA